MLRTPTILPDLRNSRGPGPANRPGRCQTPASGRQQPASSSVSVLCLALYGCDGYHTYDIIGRAASGKIVDRLGDTLGYRTISLCLGQSLGKLIADIAGVKIRRRLHSGQ